METRANYMLIGVFTLAIIAGVFGFVFWFQNLGSGSDRAVFKIVFDGSVAGLRTGSSVLFNGIRVGEVNDLRLNPDRPKEVNVTISVDKALKIRNDTQVGIEFQGLTGIAAIALTGGSAEQPALVGDKTNPPTIGGTRGLNQDVTTAAREVMRRIDDFIAQNQTVFNNSLKNIETFTGSLARNSAKIDNITSGLEALTGGADGKAGDLNEAIRSIKTLSDNLDKRTADMSDGINKFTSTATRQFDTVGKEAKQTLNQIERTVRQIGDNPSSLIFGGSKSKQN
jgi:phospholipid/cholesterol/gamma-HCH transport system substrate-binding protein